MLGIKGKQTMSTLTRPHAVMFEVMLLEIWREWIASIACGQKKWSTITKSIMRFLTVKGAIRLAIEN